MSYIIRHFWDRTFLFLFAFILPLLLHFWGWLGCCILSLQPTPSISCLLHCFPSLLPTPFVCAPWPAAAPSLIASPFMPACHACLTWLAWPHLPGLAWLDSGGRPGWNALVSLSSHILVSVGLKASPSSLSTFLPATHTHTIFLPPCTLYFYCLPGRLDTCMLFCVGWIGWMVDGWTGSDGNDNEWGMMSGEGHPISCLALPSPPYTPACLHHLHLILSGEGEGEGTWEQGAGGWGRGWAFRHSLPSSLPHCVLSH